MQSLMTIVRGYYIHHLVQKEQTVVQSALATLKIMKKEQGSFAVTQRIIMWNRKCFMCIQLLSQTFISRRISASHLMCVGRVVADVHLQRAGLTRPRGREGVQVLRSVHTPPHSSLLLAGLRNVDQQKDGRASEAQSTINTTYGT